MFIVYILEEDGKPVKAGRLAARRFNDVLADKTCLRYYQSRGVVVRLRVHSKVEDDTEANRTVQQIEGEIATRKKREETSVKRRRVMHGDGFPVNAFIEIRNGALIKVKV